MSKIILVLAVILSFLLFGCTTQPAPVQDTSNEPKTVCNKPYFEFRDGDCCLDNDYNNLSSEVETMTLFNNIDEIDRTFKLYTKKSKHKHNSKHKSQSLEISLNKKRSKKRKTPSKDEIINSDTDVNHEFIEM